MKSSFANYSIQIIFNGSPNSTDAGREQEVELSSFTN